MYEVMYESEKVEKCETDNDNKENEDCEKVTKSDSEESSSEMSSDECDEDLPNSRNSRWNNVLMFPPSDLSVDEVLEMLFGYFIQFSVGEKARIKLLELIKILADPMFKDLNISNYKINKTLDPPEDKIIYHYYCDKCEQEVVHSSVKCDIKKQRKTCNKCENVIEISLNNSSFFVFKFKISIAITYAK